MPQTAVVIVSIVVLVCCGTQMLQSHIDDDVDDDTDDDDNDDDQPLPS